MRRDEGTNLISVERLGDDLAAAFERVERLEAPEPSMTAPRRLRRRRVLIPALAAAAAICVVSSVIVSGGREAGPLTTEAALARVAKAAETNPLPFARDDQFVYTRSKTTWITGFAGGSAATEHKTRTVTALQDVDRRAWVGVYRKGMLVETRGELRFVTDREKRIGERMAKEDPLPKSDPGSPGEHVMGLGPNRGYFMDGDSGKLTRAELLAYPTDSETIYKRTLDGLHGAGQGEQDGVWQALVEPLFESPLPPKLRSGMVRALGLIPGVESLGERTDPLGRAGLAFGRVHNGARDEVLFDPESSQMLYHQSVLVEPGTYEFDGWPAGTVVARSEQHEQRVVDELPAEYAKQLK